MSQATKKRFVYKRFDAELILPRENELVGQVLSSRGRDLHEVIDQNGEQYLVSMPPRFRTTVYIRRGHFVYLLPISEGDKVKAEITHVLDNEGVLYCCEQNVWPKRFKEEAAAFTRDSKRNMKSQNAIDEDMLPPSDSDEYSSSESTGKKTGDEAEDDDDEKDASDDEEPSVYNPNRVR